MPAVVAAGREKRVGTPAILMVEMEEMEFSPTFPVWQLGTVAVGPAERGTKMEPVVPVGWAAEETAEVIP
jgi:hypothetical protein